MVSSLRETSVDSSKFIADGEVVASSCPFTGTLPLIIAVEGVGVIAAEGGGRSSWPSRIIVVIPFTFTPFTGSLSIPFVFASFT